MTGCQQVGGILGSFLVGPLMSICPGLLLIPCPPEQESGTWSHPLHTHIVCPVKPWLPHPLASQAQCCPGYKPAPWVPLTFLSCVSSRHPPCGEEPSEWQRHDVWRPNFPILEGHILGRSFPGLDVGTPNMFRRILLVFSKTHGKEMVF